MWDGDQHYFDLYENVASIGAEGTVVSDPADDDVVVRPPYNSCNIVPVYVNIEKY